MPRSETLVWRESHGCVTKDIAAAIDAKRATDNKQGAVARSNAFDHVIVERGRWVFRNGELIPKSQAVSETAEIAAQIRSPMEAPMVVRDIPEYVSMIDGSVISSRKQHRDHLRAHGCIEVGNEKLGTAAPSHLAKGEIGTEIKTAIEQIEQGYVDTDLPPTHDGDGNLIVEPDMEAIEIPADIKSGDIIRSDVKE
jgi:hypothetical protein